MTRSARTAARAAAGALTLAVTLGAGAAVAAPHAGANGHAAHAQSHRVDHAQRHVLVRIANLDARLGGVLRNGPASSLDDAVRQQVADNVLADRDTLSKLAAGVMENPTGNVAVVRETLKGLRVANYRLVVNELARAARLAGAVADAQTALAGDPAAPVAELDAAVAALQDAVDQALQVTAFSSKSDVRAVRTALAKAQASLGVVQDYRASLVETPVVG